MIYDNNGTGMYMPVAPAYGGGNNGMWGDGSWIFLWIIAMMFGGWGFGGMGGMGGFAGGWGLGYDFPWLLNGQNQINANTNSGFDHAATQAALGNLQTAVTSGFGDVQLGIAGVNQNICQTGNAITGAVRDGFSSAEIAANGRQMGTLQQLFGIQTTQIQSGCENRAAVADLKYTVAAEAAASRAAGSADTQKVLDKLCQLELDNVKGQLASAQRENIGLQNQLNMATMRESQTAQTAQILAGQAAEIDGVYNRLKNCPVPSMPVYGNTPIFTCAQSVNPGCGCGGFGFNAA